MSRRKQKINLVVFGHVNADESSIIGHLMSNCNDVYAKKKNLNENSTECSSILEKLKVAYECGDPIDELSFQFETKHYCFQIIDVPGHCHFIKNLITGLSKVACVLLIVSACENEITQIYDHLELARLLSIEQMIILINKTCSQEQFDRIRLEILNHMQTIEYRPMTLMFFSTSSIQKDQSKLCEVLDSIKPFPQLMNKPFRLPLDDVYKIGGIGTVPVGRVATGTLKPNMTVKFTPSDLSSRVKSIEIRGSIDEAVPGDYTGFSIEKINVAHLHRGFVCSDVMNDPAEEALSFLAYIVVLHSPDRITERYTSILYCHTARVACEFVELKTKNNRRSGRTIENHPKYFKTKEVGIIRIRPLDPICVERFADYPPLGRFIVRDREQNVIVGVVIDVEKKNSIKGNKRKN